MGKRPGNWFSVIRPHALAKNKFKCQRCGLPQYAVGYRDKSSRLFVPASGNATLDFAGHGQNASGQPLTAAAAKTIAKTLNEINETSAYIVIVLSVFPDNHNHLDSNLDNLVVHCQLCRYWKVNMRRQRSTGGSSAQLTIEV
jgi:hypothetical protein